MTTTIFDNNRSYLARPTLLRDQSDLIFPIELEVPTSTVHPFLIEEIHQAGKQSRESETKQEQFSNHVSSSSTSSLEDQTIAEVDVPLTGSGREAWLQGVNSSTSDSDQLTRDIGLDALNAGYSAKQLRQAGYSAVELRDHGFIASELKEAGFDARELNDAGYELYELEMAGYLIQ